MRILHAPVNIGNQAWTLSRAERNLGMRSDLVVNYNTWTQYSADEILSQYQTQNRVEYLKRWLNGLSAPFRYSVLHYYFGRSSLVFDDLPDRFQLPYLDMRIGRLLGRRIFMTLQGCDARIAVRSNQSNAFTPCAAGKCAAYETCVNALDSQRREMIENVLPLCDQVFYLNPELGHFVPDAVFMPYANVDIWKFEEIFSARSGPMRVVHAPSDPNIKGTHLILDALEQLKAEFDFELVLVKNKPHHEAMQIYQSADLVIDQVLAGWYGGFAVEVMAMGKPVASYIRQEDLHFVPKDMRSSLPIVPLHPGNLLSDLRSAFSRRHEWREIGHKSREYVERWHDPEKIAASLSRVYEDPNVQFTY